MFIKVKDHPGLVKDSYSGAILNVDKRAAEEYHRQKNMLNTNNKNKEEIAEIKEKLGEIDSLKNDMNEIKSLLNKLVDKGQ
jgi:cell shape-determining protein MreC